MFLRPSYFETPGFWSRGKTSNTSFRVRETGPDVIWLLMDLSVMLGGPTATSDFSDPRHLPSGRVQVAVYRKMGGRGSGAVKHRSS